MKIKKEWEELIVNFGIFDYNAEKISNILEVNQNIIDEELLNKKSELCRLMQKGKDMAEYVIDLKLFDMAKAGDLKALERFECRKRKWEMI